MAAGLSLRGLDRLAGVSATHLAAIEQGVASPGYDLLIRLSYYLAVDPGSLICGD